MKTVTLFADLEEYFMKTSGEVIKDVKEVEYRSPIDGFITIQKENKTIVLPDSVVVIYEDQEEEE